MFTKIKSAFLQGVEAFSLDIEVDITSTIPSFNVVGLPDASVSEARERVRSAIINSGFTFPCRRITVNMAPADVRKEGSMFDLPMAIGLLGASEQIDGQRCSEFLFAGELSLDGELRRVNGILPIAAMVKDQGFFKLILPAENAQEAALVPGLEVYPAKNLKEAIDIIRADELFKPAVYQGQMSQCEKSEYEVDFADVKGQAAAKRALEIAAAGSHNILMVGPPGSGKTMLAKRIPTILPAMTREEALEVTRIFSVAGMLSGKALVTERPFRAPHHSASRPGLVGGGTNPRPGEVSLAHRGVLFLDELPEFDRGTLEVLRQPIEDGKVTISRASQTLTFPSSFMLIASMNPCPCGFVDDPEKECSCSSLMVKRYRMKISGPLLDRIDIHIEVPRLKYDELSSIKPGESSAQMQKRIEQARNIQIDRFKSDKIFANGNMSSRQIKKYCKIPDEGKALLKNANERLGLSARAYDRILKLARTIADLAGDQNIQVPHIAEAIQYRTFDRSGWF